MRIWLVTALLLSVTLAGCTGSGGLGAYLMRGSEVPASCDLLPYDSEDGQDLRRDLNWTGNPGSVDNHVFQQGGSPEPVDNLVGLYDCDEGEVATLAVRYADSVDAQEGAELFGGDCEDEDSDYLVYNGPIVAGIDGDDDIVGMAESIDAWRSRVVQSLGATDPCAPASGGDGNETA